MSDLEGFDSLIGSLEHLSKEIPGNELTKTVKAAAGIVQRAIRSAAPEDTGQLKQGLILHKERSRVQGKVVYDVLPDPGMNALFQKPIQNPVRSKTPYGYYPASQEYGFFTRRSDGGMTYNPPGGESVTIDKVPGKHYMRTGAEVAGEAAKAAIAKGVWDIIAKEVAD